MTVTQDDILQTLEEKPKPKPLGTFKPVAWGRVKNILAPILGAHFFEAQHRVNAGKDKVYVINDYSIVLLRAQGKELVIAGFSGDINVAPLIAMKAKQHGFTSMRCHVTRKAMLRKLKRMKMNWEQVEMRHCKALNCNEYVLRLYL